VTPTPPGELLESGNTRARRERWAALSRATRRLVVVLGVLCVVAAGLAWFRNWSAERELRNRVALTTALSISSSSTTPPGGQVGYYVVVRNEGRRRVSVTAVEGTTDRLRLRMRDDAARPVDPGTETAIPLSVLLSCVPGAGEEQLPVEISLRREDGGAVTRRVDLRPTAPLLDVVTTLCGVRPDLRDHEISGPVLRFEEPLDNGPN
jgi:hypothetical protein